LSPRTFRDPGRPSLRVARSVTMTMGLVLLALLPGIAAMTVFFGPQLLGQIAVAVTFALTLEAALLALRGAALRPALTDLSAPLTAVLFALTMALTMAPTAPWWMSLVGISAAIIVAKHLCGGLGRNPFNPAMVGVAVVLLAFPAEDSHPIAPGPWVAILYATGGLFLLWKRVIPWQTPLAVLGTTVLVTLPFWLWNPDSHPSPLAHVFSGTLVLVAFFIATDPVTGCTTPRGRLLFGAGVALLTLAIQRWGGIAHGVVFALLLMNAAAPLLDRLARPRWVGEGRRAESGNGHHDG